jgi:hypothetical protein
VSSRIVWNGLAELREALRNLPAELTAEASHVVEGAANAAAADIKAAYPVRTGNLRDHVFVSHRDKGRFSAGAVVKNTAKHAHLFEVGTQARHNSLGANRGSMPPGNVFIPAMIKRRRVMYEQLKALLERHGLRATGDAR